MYMHTTRSRAAKLISSILLLVILGACTKKNENSDSFIINLRGEPTTLHPINSTDLYSRNVQSYVLDSLMTRDFDTYEWQPALAERFEANADNTEFTFFIRKNAKFHDGQPVTAHDVKFGFDAIFDDKFQAAHSRPYFENIESAEVLDDHSIKFKTRNVYFGNFNVLASLTAIPRHIYNDTEASLNKSLVGSGPYILEKYEQGKRIQLKKNPDWWGNQVEYFKDDYKFERISFRFIKEENVSLQYLKQGQLDYETLTPEAFTKKTEGDAWGKTVLKFQVQNKTPKNYGYIAWNLKNHLFADRKTRVALAHLMNRADMIEKFRYGMSLPATGPWYQQSDYANPDVKPIPYDQEQGLKLLKEAGWADSDKDGVLDKTIDGKKLPFKFTVMFSNKDSEKYLTHYQQDLKKAGIQLDIKLVEWNTFLSLVDESKFDALMMGWGGGSVDHDPKQIWHSSSAVKGGSNFIGYKNPEVDKLIDDARKIIDKPKRIEAYRKIYKLIAEDAPYLFLFNDKYVLYANNVRIKKPKDTFEYDLGTQKWSF